ncbi:hypothetical protein [Clostridium perfringens]|uniref:hypothetical protein n=1 Tax=Clostridium perfringens TaxID=1502 RepID=UPI0024BC4EA4|nr:hypothetical protein [Clostridium perfringens]
MNTDISNSLTKNFLDADIKSDVDMLEQTDTQDNTPKVFIFTSIDLVNSTSYKQQDKNWPKVFSEFFGIVETEFKKNNKDLFIWKYVGDEVLFYQEIKTFESLFKAPSETFRLMEICQDILYDKKPNCKNLLYLKASMWIAAMKKSDDEINLDIHNVIPELNESIKDFIGVDVDEGFRISKYSSQNKLVIDAKLAYILYENKSKINLHCDYNVEDRLKIVGYRKLKGIWNNRLYPIIWYHKSWANIDSMFLYDESEISDISKTLKLSNFKTEPISKLKKILKEVNLIDSKINTIKTIISNSDKDKLDTNTEIRNLVELHCVAVCINPKTKKILIAKRSNHKVSSPGKWEFGCARSGRKLEIEDTLKNDYKEDFGLDIEIIKDTDRNENLQPFPIAVYSIPKENSCSKGIIFVGKILNNAAEQIVKKTKKHDQVSWISEDEINEFSEESIPDFKDTLRKAFEFYEQYCNKEGQAN